MKRMFAVLAMLMLAVGLTVTPVQAVQPAMVVAINNGVITTMTSKQAASVYGCPEDFVCLYAWINYRGGRWQTHPYSWGHSECWNLSGSRYTDGGNVNNTSASMIINRSWTSFDLRVTFYDWVNCNSSGSNVYFDANRPRFRSNLSTAPEGNWYRKFTSLEFHWS